MSNHDREGSPPSNRDADLARAWHEASDEQPPSHLDAAIIAAARKSAPIHGAQPNAVPVRVQSRNWLLQWQPLAAAATVAGLALVLVQMLPREHDLAPSMQRTESAPIPTSVESQPRSSAVPAATDNSPLSSSDKALARPEPVVGPDRVPAPSAVPEPPVAPASPAATAGVSISESSPTADTAAEGAAGADRREAMAPAPQMAGRTATAAAAAWSAKVVALHASGDVTAAAAALRAFRAADPGADAYLPDSLRDWARTVE